MIFIDIDGKQVVPDNSSSIKLTRENPYIKESDSYTYDITLPMTIKENRDVIGPIDRLDTTKTAKTFDICRIYVDNKLLISGTGTVTSVSNADVKIQIIAGNSEIRYKSKLKSTYIDAIDYPDVASGYSGYGAGSNTIVDSVTDQLVTDYYLGEKGKYIFNTIYDETNDRLANIFAVSLSNDVPEHVVRFANAAVQPNLIYILHKVLEYMGYAVTSDVYDAQPWNEIYIASARITVNLKYALPHWTVTTFLDEVRKLLNAAYIFNENEHKVRIVNANDIANNESSGYEALDEFSSDYDDSGLESLATSNLKYNLRDSPVLSCNEELSTDVLEAFTITKYTDISTLMSQVDAGAISEKTFLTTIYCGDNGWRYGKKLTQAEYDTKYADVTDDTEKSWYELVSCGYFTKLIRNIDSDSDIDLNIVPVPTTAYYKNNDLGFSIGTFIAVVPSVENSKSDVSNGYDSDDYISVLDAVENGDDITDEEDEDERMEVFFSNAMYPTLFKYTDGKAYSITRCGTDYRMVYNTYDSFALDCVNAPSMANTTTGYIGQLHEGGVPINKNMQIIIKFLTDDIPDPKKIYVFRNKRYICSKIEIEIKDGRVDKLKTGYFYEMS